MDYKKECRKLSSKIKEADNTTTPLYVLRYDNTKAFITIILNDHLIVKNGKKSESSQIPILINQFLRKGKQELKIILTSIDTVLIKIQIL